jgi:hypothetical protein
VTGDRYRADRTAVALNLLLWAHVCGRRMTVPDAVAIAQELVELLPPHVHITAGSELAN